MQAIYLKLFTIRIVKGIEYIQLKGNRMINSKTKTVLFTLLLVFFSSLAHAGGSALSATCYPLEHGEDGQGSTNSLYLPHFITSGKWNGAVFITNVSDKYLNVKLDFMGFVGTIYEPYSYVLEGEFNSDNSPFSSDVGGAVLKPGKSARVTIFDENNDEALAGILKWQADACIKEALIVTFRSQYWGTETSSTSLTLLNDGQPF